MAKKPSEARMSQDFAVWIWNAYPEWRGLYCLNLNNTGLHLSLKMVASWLPERYSFLAKIIVSKIEELNRRLAGINKSSGLVAGRADATLYHPTWIVHFEFKLDNGVQSQAQKDWQKLVEKQGHKYYIIRSVAEGQSIVNNLV